MHATQPLDLTGIAPVRGRVDPGVHVADDRDVDVGQVADGGVWFDQDLAEAAEWIATRGYDPDIEQGVAWLTGGHVRKDGPHR